MSGIGAEGRKRQRFIDTVPEDDPVPVAVAKRAVLAEDGPTNDKLGKEGVLKDHVFDLDYLDQRGRRWQGRFKCHVLTTQERIQVGLIRSRMSGGVAPHLLDSTTASLLEVIAHLAVALDDGPAWAKRLEMLHDPGVALEIYKEVRQHEERFHGAESEDSGEAAHAAGEHDAGEGSPPAHG